MTAKPADAQEGGLRRELREMAERYAEAYSPDMRQHIMADMERFALAFARRVVEEIEKDMELSPELGEYIVRLKDIRAALSDLEQGGKGGA